jgi:hypothetical protein
MGLKGTDDMKRSRFNMFGLTAFLLAGALATAGTAHADIASADNSTPIAANGIGPNKSAIPANAARKHKRKALLQGCTAPSKSPFPCQRRR